MYSSRTHTHAYTHNKTLHPKALLFPPTCLHRAPLLPPQDADGVYDSVCDMWVLSHSASLEMNTAGLRLMLACCDAWLFHYPLTESACMEDLYK